MESTPVINRAASVLPYLSWGSHDPTVVPTHGIPGMVYIQIASWQDITAPVGIFQKTTTAGEDTNWISYGSGSSSISDYKDPVDYASTADVPLTGAFPLAIDGGSLTALDAGSRILLKNQALPAQNGIYDLVDDGGTYLLERSSDANTDALVTFGMFTWVINGTDNELSGWILTTPNPITLDTTPLTFAEIPVVSPGAVVYTPSTPADWPVTPTNVQEALDDLAETINIDNPKLIYVDAAAGSDATGTGSQLRPYQSLQAAMAAYAARGAGSYLIKLAPGDYGGAPIAIPSLLNQNLSIQGSGSTTNISAVLSFTSAGLSDETLLFEQVGVQNPFTIDLTLAGVCFILLNNGSYTVHRVDTNPPGPTFVRVQNSFIPYFQTDSLIQFLNCNFVGGPNSVIGATGNVLMFNTIFSFMVATVDGAIGFYACVTGGTNLSGTGSVSGDATSLNPLVSTLPSTTYLDNAEDIGYTPNVPTNWLSVPNTVKEALDELASVTPGNGIIFQPGGVASRNVFTTWADAVSAAQALEGPKTIFIDDSIVSPAVIPAGTYDLTNIKLSAVDFSSGGSNDVTVDDGVILQNALEFYGLDLTFNNTAVTIPLPNQVGVFVVRGSITANGSAPIFSVAAGAQFQIQEGALLNGIVGVPVINIEAGQPLQIVLYRVGGINVDAIQGDGTTTLLSFVADQTGNYVTQNMFTGSFSEVLLTKAELLGYTPTTPADWNTPPTDTKEALDELAARSNEVVYHTITIGEAAAKQITLTVPTSDLAKVVLLPVGGVPQEYSVDYVMLNSTTLSWNGLGLDGILAAGDVLLINYPS